MPPPPAIEDIAFDAEYIAWFEREVSGGGLPPAPNSDDSDDGQNDKQYVDLKELSTAFYRIVKLVAEQELLDWEIVAKFSGFVKPLRLQEQLEDEFALPSVRGKNKKELIDYSKFTEKMLQKVVAYEECLYRSDFKDGKKVIERMVIDFFEVADNALDELESFCMRGAVDPIRRMQIEEEFNTSIRQRFVLPGLKVKALGYQNIPNWHQKSKIFRKIFQRDTVPEIAWIGAPQFEMANQPQSLRARRGGITL